MSLNRCNAIFAVCWLSLGAVAPAVSACNEHAASKHNAASMVSAKGWVRAVPPVAKNTAAYVNLSNKGRQTDSILHMSSTVADKVTLHRMVDDGNGAKRMQAIPHPRLEAGQSLDLKPGGYHLMLVGLKRPLKERESVTIDIVWQHAGSQRLTLPVAKQQHVQGHHSHEHH